MTRSRTLSWALFSVGLTAIVGQVLLMRELLATLYGNELLFGLILAAWLGWGAIGAALALTGRLAAWRSRAMAVGLGAAALLLPTQLTLVRGLRTLLGATPGSMLDLGPVVLAVTLILAPLCLCLGGLFSIGTRAIVEEGGTPGRAYVWDSAGAAAGGILFSLVFVRWLDPFQTAFLVGALDFAVATSVWQHPSGEQPPGGSQQRRRPAFSSRTVVAIFALILLSMVAIPLGRAAGFASLRLQWPETSSGTAQSLLFSGDSPYGRLEVQARDSQRIFYTDGLLAFETQGTFPEEVIHPALLSHPSPGDVLLIGGGIAGDLREILKHPVDTVTYVELDPLLIEAARHYLPATDAAILDDPRVHLVMTDGRAFVASKYGTQRTNQMGNGGYDAIILDLPEPITGALNRFYTAEFFVQARDLLRPGGILSFGLPSAENYWNPELAQRNASIYRTLSAVFPAITVLPGEHNFFMASDRPIDVNPDILSQRLSERAVQTRWVTPGYLHDLMMGDRFGEIQRRLKVEGSARINRDLSPLSYYYSLAQWLARFYPGLRSAFEGASLFNLWWLVIPLTLVLLLARWKRWWRAPLVVASVGLAQMLLQLVLLFAFQALHGSLYLEVSLIVTAFMSGLALGGAAGSRILSFADRRWQMVDSRPNALQPNPEPGMGTLEGASGKDSRLVLHRVLVGDLAVMVVYGAALPLLFTMSAPQGGISQIAFLVLALIGGALGGTVFPLAAGLQTQIGHSLAGADSIIQNHRVAIADSPPAIRTPQSTIGGVLYAADLTGGCLGALLGAALFIPIAGIPYTCAAIALLAVVALLAIL